MREDKKNKPWYSFQNNCKLDFKSTKKRHISAKPYKVLDAPCLQDDYYLNLLDWSKSNMLAVGLSSCVYLWQANTSEVTKLCDLGISDHITAVNWTTKNHLIGLGTFSGDVQIWDIHQLKCVRTLTGHTGRVGSIACSNALICSGSRDKTIIMRDIRQPKSKVQTMVGHK